MLLPDVDDQTSQRTTLRGKLVKHIASVQACLDDEKYYDVDNMRALLDRLAVMKEEFMTEHNRVTDEMDPEAIATKDLHSDCDQVENLITAVSRDASEWVFVTGQIIQTALQDGQSSAGDTTSVTSGRGAAGGIGAASNANPAVVSGDANAQQVHIPSGPGLIVPPSQTSTQIPERTVDQLKDLLERRTDDCKRAERDASNKDQTINSLQQQRAAEQLKHQQQVQALERQLANLQRPVSTPARGAEFRNVQFNDTTMSNVMHVEPDRDRARSSGARLRGEYRNENVHVNALNVSSGPIYPMSTSVPLGPVMSDIPNVDRSGPDRLQSRRDYLAELSSGRFAHTSPVQPCPEDMSTFASILSHNNTIFQSFLEDNRSSLETQRLSSEMPKSKLQTFDGNPLNYWMFMKTFDDMIGTTSMRFAKKLNTLITHCCPEVKKMLSGCQLMLSEEGYHKARALLRAKYGNPFLISQAWKSKLANHPRITSPDMLETFAEDLMCCFNTLTEMGHICEMENSDCLSIIVAKLDNGIRGKWRKLHRAALRRNAAGTFRELVELVATCADEQTDPIYNNSRLDQVSSSAAPPVFGSKPAREAKKQRFQAYATCLENDDSDTSGSESEFDKQIAIMTAEATGRGCHVCGGPHYVSGCPKFEALTPKERLATARNNRLCLLCLNQGHFIGKCSQKWKCQSPGCVFRHHNLLHGAFGLSSTSDRQRNSFQPRSASTNLIDFGNETADAPTRELDVCLTAGDISTEVDLYKSITVRYAALPITPVIVFVGKLQCTTYALLDSGSTATICTNRLISILKPMSKGTAQVTINTISGRCKSTGNVYNMDIKGCNASEILPMFEVVSLEKMPISSSHIAAASDLKQWTHLKHLPIASVEVKHVDLLVGQDNAHLIKPTKTIEGRNLRDPYAVVTPLGWTIYGMTREHSAIEKKDVSLHMMWTEPEEHAARLEAQLARTWNLDKVPECDPISPVDRAVMAKWDAELVLKDGYIQLPIPLKKTRPDFPDNRAAVLARLTSLGKRLQKDKDLHAKYTTAMSVNFDKGYARIVTHDPAPGMGWYLTQLPVQHKRKLGVVRPVWNGGFVYRNRSLNDEVHQGPDMTNKIVTVVVNFRLLPVAVMGDIKQMYNQVRVPTEQQDLMRFLYWEDGDPSKKVIDCCLNYHMFGGSWSPSACSYAVRKIIELAKLDPNGETARTIVKAFYVDDCVKSIVDVATGVTLFTEIITVLGNYKFEFTKLVSNSPELLKEFPDDRKAAESVDLDFDGGRAQVQHSLGQRWVPEEDIFVFVCCFATDPKTRRELLSTLSTLYDPLGLCAPFLIPAKRLLQELTKRGLSWDDSLPPDVKEQWRKWVTDSGCITDLKIPRWVGLSSLDDRVWLVYFCDASEVAYGAVCYICTVSEKKEILTSNLLMSRSRLAPLKSQSIPRLELCAALVAAQLDESIKSFLDVKPERTLFWSDSTLVLRYIGMEPSTLKTFVSNRVSAIQQLTRREEWLHVPTELNPADCLSRGTTAQELVDSKLWLHGPEYLKQNESAWPAQPDFLTNTSGEVEKKKPKEIYSVNATMKSEIIATEEMKGNQFIRHIWESSSSWTKVIRRIAWLLLSLKRFKALRAGRAILGTALIDVEEIQEATVLVIGAAQESFLTEDMTSKKAFRKLFPRQRLGLICVGGRLERSTMPTEFKQPFVLPPTNKVTQLFVRHCHNEVYHAGVSRTLMEVRKTVWVIHGRREVQNELSKCVICKKYRSPPMTQVMADLPPYRLQQGNRPFTSIGIDYMGPLQIKVGRSMHKRYVCVIVCSATRAIHLEPATELTTSSFLRAFSRFTSRRGKPSSVLSDNGTNFVGAKAELARETAFWNAEDIHLYCADKGIKWKFNPPAASHFGGMWERHNRTIRSLMLNMTGGSTLSEESFNTVLCLIEASLNSRPLTKMTDDPTDPSPITPNLLLLGEDGDPIREVSFSTDTLRKTWKHSQFLADCFWKRWTGEYLHELQRRTKWLEMKENLKIGDLVLVVQDTMPRHVWPLGLVQQVHVGHDGVVRAADVKMASGVLTRPIVKLVLLEANLATG